MILTIWSNPPEHPGSPVKRETGNRRDHNCAGFQDRLDRRQHRLRSRWRDRKKDQVLPGSYGIPVFYYAHARVILYNPVQCHPVRIADHKVLQGHPGFLPSGEENPGHPASPNPPDRFIHDFYTCTSCLHRTRRSIPTAQLHWQSSDPPSSRGPLRSRHADERACTPSK